MATGSHPARGPFFRREEGGPEAWSPGRRKLAPRLLRGVAIGLGVFFLFLGALVVAVLGFLGSAPGGRMAARRVNAILADSFQGRLEIRRLRGIGLFGVGEADATLFDPTGAPVIDVRGASVRIATLAAVRSLLFGGRDAILLPIPSVSLRDVDVRLDTDASGQLRLLAALAPRHASAPPDPNARGLRLVATRIRLEHGWVHGQMASAPPLDVHFDDLVGEATVAPDDIEATLSHMAFDAKRIAQGLDAAGILQAQLTKKGDAFAGLSGRVDWKGTLGTSETSLAASLEGGRMTARLELPRIAPGDVRVLWPSSAIEAPAAVRLDAHGTLPELAVDLRTRLGSAGLDITGTLSLGAEKRADLSLEGHDLDVHPFLPSAAASRLALRGHVAAAAAANGSLHGEAQIHFLGGDFGGSALPAASIRASAERPADRPNGLQGDAELVIEEPSAPTRVVAHWSPRGQSSAVSFVLDSSAADLDAVPELRHVVAGSARLTAKGTLDLERTTIDADVEASVKGLRQGDTRVQRAEVGVHARGALLDPDLQASVRATGVAAASLRYASVEATVGGRAKAPRVTLLAQGIDSPDVDASASLSFASGFEAGPVHVILSRLGDRAVFTAERVEASGARFHVTDGQLRGLGSPTTFALDDSPGGVRARVSTSGLDLARLGRVLRLEDTLRRGKLSVDADVDVRRGGLYGRASVDLSDGSFANLENLAGQVEMKLDGRSASGHAHVQMPGVATVDVQASRLTLGGAAGSWSSVSWRETWGDVTVDASGDLATIEALVPPTDFPLAEAKGQVSLKGHLLRAGPAAVPGLTVTITTDGLLLAGKSTAHETIDGVYVTPSPWRLAGIDFDIDGKLDAATGALEVSTGLRDKKGPLAQASAKAAHVPVRDVLAGGGHLANDVRQMPFDLRVTVPERGLGGLPAMLKQNYLTGRVKAELNASGTLVRPKVHLDATVRQSHVAGTARSLPLEFTMRGDYDGARATIDLQGQMGGHEVLHLGTNVDAPMTLLLAPAPEATAAGWKASTHAHLTAFPLDAIVWLDDKVVSGQLTGDVALDDLHADARADVNLDVDSLTVGTAKYRSATIRMKADGHVVDASVRIDQKDGFLETKARAPSTWGAAMAPVLDPGQPLGFSLSAKSFQVAGLLPFVDHWLDELDGRLDADVHGALDARSKGAQLTGTLAVHKGVVEVNSGGGELHDVEAQVTLAPEGMIKLEKLTASGVTGRLEGSGSVRLVGTRVSGVHLVLSIPQDSPFPLAVAGTEIGNLDGRIELDESPPNGTKDMNLKVEVPHVRISLPDASPNNAQPLGTIPALHIGAHRGHPLRFIPVPLDPVTPSEPPSDSGAGVVDIRTHLADVQIVRSTQLDVSLTGDIDVKAAAKTSVTGRINLKRGGVLSVQGKTFVVDSGTVSFVSSDPSNPEVVVKAGWTAPDGTTVYANFVGPLKTGKVTLTSEPSLPQEEIVQLLLFGAPDGKQTQSPAGNPATSAIGTVGGEAAQPLNHALNQLGLGTVTTKVDTSESATPKPEVAVQIARDISIQIAMVLGQPPPGVNPDHTLLSVDWRFLSKWSLTSTVGDAGTTIFDLLWEKRY